MWHLFAHIPMRGGGYGDDVDDGALSKLSDIVRRPPWSLTPPRRRPSEGILAGVACADTDRLYSNKTNPIRMTWGEGNAAGERACDGRRCKNGRNDVVQTSALRIRLVPTTPTVTAAAVPLRFHYI